MKSIVRSFLVGGILVCTLVACGSGSSSTAERGDRVAVVRGSPFLGCYALTTGAWDNGHVLYEGIRKPRGLRLDSVPTNIPLHAAFRAEVEPAIGQGLDRVGWWPSAHDTALVYATEGGWSGYTMKLAVDGDSIWGWAEETSDVRARYRTHAVRGMRRPCSAH